MTHDESKGSVQKEQFGKPENTEKSDHIDPESTDENLSSDNTKDSAEGKGIDQNKEKQDSTDKPDDKGIPDDKNMPDKQAEEKIEDKTEVEEKIEDKAEDKTEVEDEAEDKAEVEVEEKVKAEAKDESTEKKDIEEGDKKTDKSKSGESEGEPTPPKYVPEKIDYSKLSKEDLVKVLRDLIDSGNFNEIRKDVDAIKSNFYKQNKAEVEEIKQKFLEEGGQIQDFKIEESPLETELKELVNKYREFKNELNKKLESEKETNLAIKLQIIEGIKDLINSQESLNKTFHDFRELQNRWREAGPVPQGNLKDLWEKYHYHVEAFYDYIKINKELRDLDFKKNLEAKIKLCERAEELLLEPSVVEAFRKLQKLHDQWREIGPVPIDKRTELWERFKEATTKINRKHQEYFVNLKQEQKKNYEEKLVLCEKAEEIAALEIDKHEDWQIRSRELIELQKVWKKIGFAPKKYNTQVYERFRKACDSFFDKKREYYSHNREEQQNNLQLKTELCIQAEGLQDSTEWKKTTNDLIALQKRWKEIGPVPAKQSEKIWKRFRAACDTFFNNKSEFYAQIDTRYEENLEKKKKLIEDIEKYELTNDVEKNLSTLKDFQHRWSEIGFVPIKEKNDIQEQYRQTINAKFDSLKVDDTKKAILKYRNRIENMTKKPNSQHRMRMEREKFFTKLKQLENDITLWENNIGFFSDTENAESMINDVHEKIDSAKQKMEVLKAKIRLLDEYEE